MANSSTISLCICILAFASTIATRTRVSDIANPKNMVNISRSLKLTCYFCNSCSEATALKSKETCKEGHVCVKQVMRNNYPVRSGTYSNVTITRGCVLVRPEDNWKIDGSCENLETLKAFAGSFQCLCSDENLCNLGNTRWITSTSGSLGLFMTLLALLVNFS